MSVSRQRRTTSSCSRERASTPGTLKMRRQCLWRPIARACVKPERQSLSHHTQTPGERAWQHSWSKTATRARQYPRGNQTRSRQRVWWTQFAEVKAYARQVFTVRHSRRSRCQSILSYLWCCKGSRLKQPRVAAVDLTSARVLTEIRKRSRKKTDGVHVELCPLSPLTTSTERRPVSRFKERTDKINLVSPTRPRRSYGP